MKHLATIILSGSLLMGCQTSEPSPAAAKPADASKAAPKGAGDAANVSATSGDVDSAKLAEIARAAAEGKAAPSASKVAALPPSPHDKAGFVTKVDDGRLWVFKKDAKELAEFIKHGELVKSVTRIGVGPNRMTVRAADAATIDAYLAAAPVTNNVAPAAAPTLPSSPHDKEGFVTKVDDGRLWVFKKDAKELAEFIKHGELVKSVTRVGVGPNRMTVRAADAATIDAYLAASPATVNAAPAAAAPALPSSPHDKEGFVTKLDDGRLWVFKKDAKELAEFIKHGELVKSVTRVGAGPNRMTIRAADAATIDAYLAAAQ